MDCDALAATLNEALSGETRARLAANTRDGLDRFEWAALVEQTNAALARWLEER